MSTTRPRECITEGANGRYLNVKKSEEGDEDEEDEYGDPSQIRNSTVSGLRGILREISGMVGKIREKKQLEGGLEHTAEQKMDMLEEVKLTDEDWEASEERAVAPHDSRRPSRS